MAELSRISAEDFQKSEKIPIVLVLDNVRSMMNTGSVFRTADAFLLESVYLCGITATPPHREIQKTALGATESMHWMYFEETTAAVISLKAKGYKVLAIEQAVGSHNLKDFLPEKNQPYALIFGNEVKGVSQEVIDLCDACIEIPQFGTKHSLNVAVTAGMVIWDFFSKTK